MVEMVKKTAIGSLLPDSSSNKEDKSFRNRTFLSLRIEKTAAASVEEMIAPIRIPCRNENFNIQTQKRPALMAVRSTPAVDKVSAGPTAGRTSFQSVSIPPEKRINTKEATPINWAKSGSSKYMPPGPSLPANIPKTKNKTKAGTPKRLDILLDKTSSNKSRPARNRSYSTLSILPK